MNELILALCALTSARHEWPMPPKSEPVIVMESRSETPAVADGQLEQLRRAVEAYTKQVTGRLRPDPQSGLYLPELTQEQNSTQRD